MMATLSRVSLLTSSIDAISIVLCSSGRVTCCSTSEADAPGQMQTMRAIRPGKAGSSCRGSCSKAKNPQAKVATNAAQPAPGCSTHQRASPPPTGPSGVSRLR